jgi:hypothetical protein
MLYLEKGQKLFDNEGMVVYDQTGYYNDDDSIICAMVYSPEEPVCRYEAKFVAYGNNVYNITDPEKLLEEIKKIDPQTLFGKNKEVIATQKMVDNIQTTESEDLSLPQNTDVPANETPATEEPVLVPEENTQVTETPEVIVSDTSTTTPEVIDGGSSPATSNTSSTTPEIIIPDTASTTPETITATTTEPVAEQIVPAIENVIEDLTNISDIIQNESASTTTTTITQ